MFVKRIYKYLSNNPQPKIKYILFSLLFFVQIAKAQIGITDTIPKWEWVNLMLSERPNYFQVKKAFDGQFNGIYPKKGTGYKVFKRWESRIIQYVDDSGFVNWPKEQINEFLNIHGAPSSKSGPSGSSGIMPGNPVNPATYCADWGRWQAVGPNYGPYNQSTQPTGIGRISGIAFNPKDTNTFFALAPQGGVWKTTDYGKTWKHIWNAGTNNAFVTLGASTMVLSYNNPDTFYIGTGDRDAGDAPGYGVIYSMNGGTTFSARNTGMGNVAVSKILMHPKNSAILIAATNSGIFRSTNSGALWTKTTATFNFSDIDFHPYNPSILYAASNGLFYRSTDGGASFLQITNGIPSSGMQRGQIAVTKSDRGRVYFLVSLNSKFGGFYVSLDSGLSFTNANSSPANILGYSELGTDGSGQGWYDLDVAADPFNKNTVYAYGVNIWKSTNAGASFTVCGHWVGAGSADDVHADQHAGEFNSTGRTLFSANDGGIYFSQNGGKTWNNISNGIQNSQIYRMSVAQTVQNMSAQGYQDNGSAQQSRDRFYTYYGGDGMDCAVDPTDEKYVYGSYVMGVIYRCQDRKDVIDICSNGVNGVNEGGGWLTPFVLQEGNPNKMFAGYSNIWRCDSVKKASGFTFTKISSGFPGTVRYIKNSIAKNSILYVIRGDGKLYRSNNVNAANPTWTDISANIPAGVALRAIETHPKDSNILYMAGYTTLYKSTNQGGSWTAIGNFGNATPVSGFNYGIINCLKYDTSGIYEEIYIGSDRGVYVYLNGSSGAAGINEFSTGFPMWADVSDLDIYHYPKNRMKSTIYTSTYGRGVWRSNLVDYGSFSTPKLNVNFYAFDSILTVGGKVKLYENVEGSITSLKWVVKPSTFTWLNNDSIGKSPEVQFSAPGVYSVSLTAWCCGTVKTTTKKLWIKVFPIPSNMNCRNTTTYSTVNYGIGHTKVVLSDNQNETGMYFDDGEYNSYTNSKVFRIKPNVTQTLKVTGGLSYPDNIRVFIDYNNNGKFENWKSEVLGAKVANGLSDAILTFTPPASIPRNKSFTMRILSDYYAIDTTPCKNLGYGKGEDYSLVYDVSVPNFTANKSKVCSGSPVVFRDTSEGVIGEWDWDFGVGAMPNKISGKGPHYVIYSSGGNKNVKLKINGTDSITKTAFIQVTQKPTAISSIKVGSSPSCEGSNITLNVSESNRIAVISNWYNVNWNLKSADSLFAISNLTIKDTGIYYAIVNNAGCLDTSDAIKIEMFAKPKAAFTLNNSAQCLKGNNFNCTNQSTIAFNTISTYQWQVLNTTFKNTMLNFKTTLNQSGNYSIQLIVKSDKNCIDSLNKQIQVYAQPKANFQFVDSIQCDKNNSFVVTNKSTIIPNETIYSNWLWADGKSENANIPLPHSFTGFGDFKNTLIVKTIRNCADTISKIARIYETAKPSYDILNTKTLMLDSVFCENELFKISNSTITKDIGTYVYSLNNISFIGKTQDLSFNKFGKINITLKVNHLPEGCADSLMKSVNILSNPTALFSAKPNPICALQQTLNLTNLSINPDGNPLQYLWNIGQTDTSNLKNPTYIFLNSGDFKINLTVNNQGCFNSSSTDTIHVVPAVKSDFYSVVDWNKNLHPNRYGVIFKATDTLIAGYTYSWFFDTSKASFGKTVVNYFNSNKTSPVKLIVSNSLGCTDTTIKNVVTETPSLKAQNNVLSFYVYPNPTNNKTTFTFKANKGDEIDVKITTILGQQFIYQRHWNISESGNYFETINFDDLHVSAGVYPIEITRGTDILNAKIVYAP